MMRLLLSRLLPPRLRAAAIRAEALLLRELWRTPVAVALRPLLLRRYLARPEEVDIEVTSSCDADCIMCPRRAMRRAPGPMPRQLFDAIVDEAVALGVRQLVLNGYGEIATLQNAREYLEGIRRRSRTIRVLVNTNGMRLTEELAAAFIDCEVDVVNITIDGATAETYEQIRKHLKLERVEQNVRRLIAMRDASGRGRPLISVHMISMAQNVHEAEAFMAKWNSVADCAGISGLVSRGGAVDAPAGSAGWASTPCFLLWRQMPILSDGTVAMCCDDWDGSMELGNVASGGIAGIWTSAAHEGLRRLHLKGRAAELDLCRGCQSPRRPPAWFPVA